MRLQDIMIGLVVLLVATAIIIGIAIDMYSPDHYNVDLNNDASTQQLAKIQNRSNSNIDNMKGSYEEIRQKTPGQNQSSYNPQIGLTEGDLQRSALATLKESHTFLDTFTDMLSAVMNVLDLNMGTKSMLLWFFGLLIGIPLVFLLVNAFLKNMVG